MFAATPGMSRRVLLIVLVVAPLLDAAASAAPQAQRAAKATSASTERYQVAAGTALLVKLLTALDSSTASVGQQVDATLWSPVVQDGTELIPVGSKLFGRVVAVDPASERQLIGTLTLTFSIVEHADTGDRATMNTRPLAFEAPAPVAPVGKKKVKLRPIDVTLAEGASLVAVTSEPLVVRIPRTR